MLHAMTQATRFARTRFVGSLLVAFSTLVLIANSGKAVTLSSSLSATGSVVLKWDAAPTAHGYRVEYRDTVSGTNWLPCPWQDQWPTANLSWTDSTKTGSARFYRVMALTNPRGAVVSSTVAGAFTASQLATLLALNNIPITPTYGVTIFSVKYHTVTADGAPTIASGALVLPQAPGVPLPLLSLQHGTVILTNDVPSAMSGEIMLGAAWASVGYATSMPDYLGLGGNQTLHPYVHARSEATAVIDMLRAAKLLCAQSAVNLNGKLFLAGYSQGGHATMAAHREIEQSYAAEFPITASAPMAGPYDLSGATMTALLQPNQPYTSPWYVPYVVLGFNAVYRLYPDLSQVLLQPYATTLPPLFDGQHPGNQINDAMPAIPSQIFRPEFLQDFGTNASNPFRLALQRNDLYNWRPIAAMRLFHCAGDTTVPYANSVVALNTFQANGATQVQLIDPYPAGNHATGALPCYQAARAWFDLLKN